MAKSNQCQFVKICSFLKSSSLLSLNGRRNTENRIVRRICFTFTFLAQIKWKLHRHSLKMIDSRVTDRMKRAKNFAKSAFCMHLTIPKIYCILLPMIIMVCVFKNTYMSSIANKKKMSEIVPHLNMWCHLGAVFIITAFGLDLRATSRHLCFLATFGSMIHFSQPSHNKNRNIRLLLLLHVRVLRHPI